MNVSRTLNRTFLRALVATAAGRAHLLGLMVLAEEGDEAAVFDQLKELVTDPELKKAIARHQEDEREHARLYYRCLERNGLPPPAIPGRLLIIRRANMEAELELAPASDPGRGRLVQAAARGERKLSTSTDVMNAYALLLAVEERGVQQFPIIGDEFRRIGDYETADVFDRVAKDEARHTRYCYAIGRRHAPDEETWRASVLRMRAVEKRAFDRVGLAQIAHAIRAGLVWNTRAARALAAALELSDPMRFDSSTVMVHRPAGMERAAPKGIELRA